jgi:rhodanese-related sulfurtransferase
MSKDEFVSLVTSDLAPPPPYFGFDAEFNRRGAPALSDLAEVRALSIDEVRREIDAGAVVLDVRENTEFGAGHVPGSVSIGLNGQFASWAGTLLDPVRDVVLVADDPDDVREATVRLARVGFERVAGYLEGGVEAWRAAGGGVSVVAQISVADLAAALSGAVPGLQVIDVRRPAEYASGHVPGAVNVPLDARLAGSERLDPARPTAVICAGGYRSSAATSILVSHGFTDLRNVLGGTGAWVRDGFPVETAAPEPVSSRHSPA